MLNNMKPRIISIERNIEDKIKHMIIKDTAKKIGGSAFILVPNELIGKYLKIELEII
jgi:putative transposon-encoded protein